MRGHRPGPIHRLFGAHPEAVGESYLQHLARASAMGLRMVKTGVACLVHALVPAAFTQTGSREIEALHREIAALRRAQASDS